MKKIDLRKPDGSVDEELNRGEKDLWNGKALGVQVGGDHYKNKPIQPVEYIVKNNIGFCEGNVIKYVTRWKSKNGIDDLKKAKHYIDLLIQLQTLDTSGTLCNNPDS